jgi:hypothetical protein
MQDKDLFEYAVIRVMPRVEREEFINVGVILLCRKQQFLQALYTVNAQKLLAFCDQLDIQEIEAHLGSFVRICAGGSNGGPIGQLTPAERFRWLTAMRSTIIQTSRVHPGMGSDPATALQKLFDSMVL